MVEKKAKTPKVLEKTAPPAKKEEPPPRSVVQKVTQWVRGTASANKTG